MLSLLFIWTMTKILIVSSVGTMLVLIVRRFLAERRERREEAHLRELRPVLFYCLEQHESMDGVLARQSDEDRRGLVLLSRRLIDALIGPSRATLVEMMHKLGYVEELLHNLVRGTVPARLQASTELGWFDRAEVHAALRKALQDKEYGVRLGAANSLLLLNDRAAIPEIMRHLTEGFDPLPLSLRSLFRRIARMDPATLVRQVEHGSQSIAVLSIEALAAAPSSVDIHQLCRVAINHSSKDARAAALRTLGLLAATEHGKPALSTELLELVPLQNVILEGALRSEVVQAVRRGLTDRDWEVRTQGVICTQRLGLTEMFPRLLALQSDPQWWVRFRSSQALVRLQGLSARRAPPPPVPLPPPGLEPLP